MKSTDVRESFLSYFEKQGHRRVSSASVAPGDDPTLYFTNAGMNQFKDIFLGLGRRDYMRAVDSQKCIRVSGKHNDLEEVGRSPRHHTFFEMLGNWSFGDYFKKEAIEWAWELLTDVWGLDKRRLWGTVFEGDEADGLDADDESQRLWGECTDMPADRVVKLSARDVFWEMGETGPCGPSSELHYYLGPDLEAQTAEGLRRGDDDFLEIWNLVFIQFNRDATGTLEPLPAKHVDTGMGLERICSILQGVDSNYETDMFSPLINRVADFSDREFEGEDAVAMQVIADHVRALTFAIADGALPSNEGAGYVLRRILRRAARYGRTLGQTEPFICDLSGAVGEVMGAAYPEVVDKAEHISLVIRSEEEGFGTTLDRGLEIFERVAAKGEVTGAEAFLLHDTYGFPLDLTQLMARERGLAVDTIAFESELEGQRQRARAATRKQQRMASGDGQPIAGEHSRFTGYGELVLDTEVVESEVDDDGNVKLYLMATPFYAESGGQVGDRGQIAGEGFALDVEQTLCSRGGIAHIGRLSKGSEEAIGGHVSAAVDETARLSAARNHTATHLFHEVLRRTLGEHVAQMGSLVAPSRLRFDFSHFAHLDDPVIEEIEEAVNEQIRADLDVIAFEENLETAKSMGAKALFGEKYGDRVRVVKIADFSLELCGGTHVQSTGQIGLFTFLSEGGVAAGTRRAEVLTGIEAERSARQQRVELARARRLLNASGSGEMPRELESLIERNRELEKALAEIRRGAAGETAEGLIERAVTIGEIRVVAARVEVSDADSMRSIADRLRDQLGSGAGVLGSILKGKVTFIAVVTDDLASSGVLKAGDIVRDVAKLAGGSGGGKPHMAQAGGRDPEKIDGALAATEQIVRVYLET